MILVQEDCNTPEQAIGLAGQLLIDNGYCTENYCNQMIENFHEWGDYIVIDEFIAMPHARPEDGAIQSGFSIVTLKKPVNFGNDGDITPVSVVCGLVGTTADEHILTISKLADLFDSPSFLDALMKCETEVEAARIIK